jgi:hypothetical protein
MARFEDICETPSATIFFVTDGITYNSLVLFHVDLIPKYDLFIIQYYPLNQVVTQLTNGKLSGSLGDA